MLWINLEIANTSIGDEFIYPYDSSARHPVADGGDDWRFERPFDPRVVADARHYETSSTLSTTETAIQDSSSPGESSSVSGSTTPLHTVAATTTTFRLKPEVAKELHLVPQWCVPVERRWTPRDNIKGDEEKVKRLETDLETAVLLIQPWDWKPPKLD